MVELKMVDQATIDAAEEDSEPIANAALTSLHRIHAERQELRAALALAAECRTSHESTARPPDFYESAFNVLVGSARALLAKVQP